MITQKIVYLISENRDSRNSRRNKHCRKERWPKEISSKYRLANSFDDSHEYSYHRQPSIKQQPFSFTFLVNIIYSNLYRKNQYVLGSALVDSRCRGNQRGVSVIAAPGWASLTDNLENPLYLLQVALVCGWWNPLCKLDNSNHE